MVKHGKHKMPNGVTMSDAEMAEHMGGKRAKKPSNRRPAAKKPKRSRRGRK